MAGIREFINSPRGRVATAVAASALSVFSIGFLVWVLLAGSNPAVSSSTDRVFVCAETGKTFRHTIRVGDTIPLMSPYSGSKTGYEPESCYWTADGKPTRNPTYVLLNETIGKPGPTFCPDCDRLVVGMNPAAIEGSKPPPTQREFAERRRQN
jgi:hypothetical protein